jgi:hypothetical protein
MPMRQGTTHPSERGADQATNLIQAKYGEERNSNQTTSMVHKEMVRRGEDEPNKFPVPV